MALALHDWKQCTKNYSLHNIMTSTKILWHYYGTTTCLLQIPWELECHMVCWWGGNYMYIQGCPNWCECKKILCTLYSHAFYMSITWIPAQPVTPEVVSARLSSPKQDYYLSLPVAALILKLWRNSESMTPPPQSKMRMLQFSSYLFVEIFRGSRTTWWLFMKEDLSLSGSDVTVMSQ